MGSVPATNFPEQLGQHGDGKPAPHKERAFRQKLAGVGQACSEHNQGFFQGPWGSRPGWAATAADVDSPKQILVRWGLLLTSQGGQMARLSGGKGGRRVGGAELLAG